MARTTKFYPRKNANKWYGVFADFPNEKGNPREKPLATFEEFPPIESSKGKLIPQDDHYDEIIGRWMKNRDQLEN